VGLREDPDIAAALEEASVAELAVPTIGRWGAAAASELVAAPGEPAELARRGYRNERLDNRHSHEVFDPGRVQAPNYIPLEHR